MPGQGHSRASSTSRPHTPATPSGLRASSFPPSHPSHENHDHDDTGHAPSHDRSAGDEGSEHHMQRPLEPIADMSPSPNVRTRLLSHDNWDQESGCGSEHCEHGTFSPRPYTRESTRTYGSINSNNSVDGFGGPSNPNGDRAHDVLGTAVTEGLLRGHATQKPSPTEDLARRNGVRHRRMIYLAYYLPVLNWVRQYKWSYLRGDFIAATTMASFYIPMSLSLASNLGHIPPINGMYAFVFNPLMYALLGTCPQMIVGPEAAGSLLTGTVVRENIERGQSREEEDRAHAEIAGAVTSTAGAIIFLAGLTRLGFLDSVLSRPFLRGFISAIGFVIFVEQLLPELGLTQAAIAAHVSHGSVVDKVVFIVTHLKEAHGLTCAVSLGAFAIIMVCRETKARLQPRYPSMAYIPDRFIIVVLSGILTWRFRWEDKGLEILGNIRTGGHLFAVHNPFQARHLTHVADAISTSFIIALLGFFESSVAAKSLGTGSGGARGEGLKNIPMSPNRELVALGVANLVGGTFMALPAFGGYGRSKVNASTGGKTPMSNVFLSLIAIFCCFVLLPYFYYLPKGVLSSLISVVAYSLIEEAPHDIRFFWRIRGWSELTLMLIIFVVTMFWDLKTGVAVGIGLSILRVVRHSTRPRIQILGRVPGTTDQFRNAEANPDAVEFIEGCLIVKIPEPLTFANTGDLKSRLRRLEDYGTTSAHPALPRVRREEHNKNIIFDVHGVTSLDGAGAQVLCEIVDSYRARNVRVFFCRIPAASSDVWRLFEVSGMMEACGGRSHFVSSVQEALHLTESEEESLDGDSRSNV